MNGYRFASLVALLLCSGCASVSFPLRRSDAVPAVLRGNNIEIAQRLHEKIPVGTSRVEAIAIATSLGLEPDPQVPGTAPDLITFQYSGPNGLFGQATWIVTIECPDGKVAELFCEKISVE